MTADIPEELKLTDKPHGALALATVAVRQIYRCCDNHVTYPFLGRTCVEGLGVRIMHAWGRSQQKKGRGVLRGTLGSSNQRCHAIGSSCERP